MRIVAGTAAAAIGLGLAGVAHAAPADLAGGKPLVPVDKVVPIEARLSPEFRVRADLVTSTAGNDPLRDPDGPMQHRFASSMIDYYPLAGSGLRLSAGMKFFAVANFLRDAEKATGGLLYAPRLPGSGSGVRTGFNRHTPAATLGYTGGFKNAVFGFEMGTLIGNANANLPRSYAALGDRRGGINPIANLMFGLKF